MYKIDEDEKEIRFAVSSEMRLVDRVAHDALEFVGRNETGDSSNIKLTLRELLINAVEHGNRKIPARVVKCSLERLPKSLFRITVEDEGEGFDYKNIDLSLPSDPLRVRNRGLPLVYAASDVLEFGGTGNRITAYVSLIKETAYALSEESGWCVITPSGNITASTTDKLLEILRRLIDEKKHLFRFDLKNVRDIDSVGMSAMIVLSKILRKTQEKFELELTGACPDIGNLVEITGLDSLYKIVKRPAAVEGGQK
jgi:anti-anti-sigma factor